MSYERSKRDLPRHHQTRKGWKRNVNRDAVLRVAHVAVVSREHASRTTRVVVIRPREDMQQGTVNRRECCHDTHGVRRSMRMPNPYLRAVAAERR
jgi:hypothetical protein